MQGPDKFSVGSRDEVPQKLKHFVYKRINLATTWKDMTPPKLFKFGQHEAAVYAFQLPHSVILYRLGSLNCILQFAAADVRLCKLCSLVDNYRERKIKYEGFAVRPSVGGRPGARIPMPTPLNSGTTILCRAGRKTILDRSQGLGTGSRCPRW